MPAVQEGFRQLAEGFADGIEAGSPRFNKFLELGIAHFASLAETNTPFRPVYERLMWRYKRALVGGYGARANFCEAEATYLLGIAGELRSLGEGDKAEILVQRAQNWRNAAYSLTMV